MPAPLSLYAKSHVCWLSGGQPSRRRTIKTTELTRGLQFPSNRPAAWAKPCPRHEIAPMNPRLLRITDWENLARQADFEPGKMADICPVSIRQLERFFAERFH